MPFSLRHSLKTKPIAIALLALGAATVFALGVRAKLSTKLPPEPFVSSAQAKATPVARSIYVNRGALQPQLREVIKAIGDRLEKPGKERLTINGVITRVSKKADKQPVRLVMEFPNKLRLEESDSITTFDGKDLKNSKTTLKKEEEEDIESLLLDSIEQFFTGLIRGQALRTLGVRFQDTSVKPGVAGNTFYDLYQMLEVRTVKKEPQQQSKLYYVNSTSLLLEKISYQAKRNNRSMKVEVQFSDWKSVNGQKLPGKITRLEDGLEMLVLEVNTLTLSPMVADGIFSLPTQ